MSNLHFVTDDDKSWEELGEILAQNRFDVEVWTLIRDIVFEGQSKCGSCGRLLEDGAVFIIRGHEEFLIESNRVIDQRWEFPQPCKECGRGGGCDGTIPSACDDCIRGHDMKGQFLQMQTERAQAAMQDPDAFRLDGWNHVTMIPLWIAAKRLP